MLNWRAYDLLTGGTRLFLVGLDLSWRALIVPLCHIARELDDAKRGNSSFARQTISPPTQFQLP